MSEDSTRRMSTLEAPEANGDPQEPAPVGEHYQPVQKGRKDKGGGRFWSTRRVPAFVVGLLVLCCSGVLLYDIAAVRAGQQAAGWRRSLADALAERRLDDAFVVVCAIAVVLIGCWLLLLALAPGARGLLTMRGEPHLRAGIERSAAALVLRDRAMEVPGVRTASVKVRRSRVKARAEAHFRDVETVRTEVDAALADGVRQLGLATRPRLRVRVDSPAKR